MTGFRKIRPRHFTHSASRDSLARDPSFDSAQQNEVEIWRTDSLRADLAALAQYAVTATAAEAAAIALEEDGAVVCRARFGRCAPAIGTKLDPDSGISGLCLRMGDPVRCDDAELDARVNLEAARSLGIRSILAVPLVCDGNAAGLVEVFSSRPHAFGRAEEASLQGAAYLVAGLLGPERWAEDAGFIRAVEKIRAWDGRALTTSAVQEEPAEVRALVAEASSAAGTNLSVLERYSEAERVEGKRILAVFAATVVLMLTAGLWVWRGTASASRGPSVAARSNVPEVAALLARINSGDAKAAAALSHEYERGEKLSRDPKAAVMWLQRAAEEGDSTAQYELAVRQWEGNGTQQDEAAAMAWLQKSARQGNSDAQLGLGKAYAEGRGVQKDPVKAYACFALSSDLGNQEGETALNQLGAALSRSQLADARALVGQMYAAGVVAPVNQVAAYTWLTLAESAGSKKASQEKLTVASKLSKVEVTRAIEGAQQWQRSHRR